MLSFRSTPMLVLVVGLGCAPATELELDAERRAPTAGGRYGLVVLTHEFSEPGVAVSGQLMDWRGASKKAALQAVAAPELAFLTAPAPRPGTCRALRQGPERLPESVDLLAVGPMTVRPPAPLVERLELSPRDFPAVTFELSGVVYDADAPQRLPYLAGGPYTVQAPGDELGALEGRVRAPPAVWLEQVEVDAEGARLRWGGPADATVLLWRDAGTTTVGLSCRAAGRAELSLDAAALRGLGGLEVQLVVAEVRRAPLRVVGVEDAELIFISRDTVELDLSPLHHP